ncbi:hypothetical protein V6N13_015181 [Hibiscus sabdariffa]|uniref:Uncharacterized protein n=2 Tax=Hibiscus sabdariffa TaxID=183260 RepID=A0ABR2NHJ5_9ROSI
MAASSSNRLHQSIVYRNHNTERANKHKWKIDLSTSSIFRRDLKNFSKEASTTASTISDSAFCDVKSATPFSNPFFESLSFFSITTTKPCAYLCKVEEDM